MNSRETLASNSLLHSALLDEFAQIFEGRGLEPLPDCYEDGSVSTEKDEPATQGDFVAAVLAVFAQCAQQRISPL